MKRGGFETRMFVHSHDIESSTLSLIRSHVVKLNGFSIYDTNSTGVNIYFGIILGMILGMA